MSGAAGSGEHLRELKLTTPEMRMLDYIAGHGGEISWDWSKVNANAKAMVANMINNRLVIEREYVTHAAQLVGALKLALTEQGRAVHEQIEKLTLAQGTKPTPKVISG